MRTAITKDVTHADLDALDLVFQCGFVFLSLNGEPHLQTHTQITGERFRRLLHLGLLKPSDDALYGPSQTYKPTLESYASDKKVQKLLEERKCRPVVSAKVLIQKEEQRRAIKRSVTATGADFAFEEAMNSLRR